jgi:hypothetical protein
MDMDMSTSIDQLPQPDYGPETSDDPQIRDYKEYYIKENPSMIHQQIRRKQEQEQEQERDCFRYKEITSNNFLSILTDKEFFLVLGLIFCSNLDVVNTYSRMIPSNNNHTVRIFIKAFIFAFIFFILKTYFL